MSTPAASRAHRDRNCPRPSCAGTSTSCLNSRRSPPRPSLPATTRTPPTMIGGPPLDEDAPPPLDEEPPADWEPPAGYGRTNSQPDASAPASPMASAAATPAKTSTTAPPPAAATTSPASSTTASDDPWSRAVEQAPGTWVVGTESNVGKQPAQDVEESAPATNTPDYEPAAAQAPAPAKASGTYGHPPTNAEENPSSSWDVAPASSWPAAQSMPAPPTTSNAPPAAWPSLATQPRKRTAPLRRSRSCAVGQSNWPAKPVSAVNEQPPRSPSGPCPGAGEDPGEAGVGGGGHSQPGRRNHRGVPGIWARRGGAYSGREAD